MSATIPDTMPLEEITKATGYDCPEDLQGVTFKEATSGIGGGMSAGEINEMVTRLIADKQDKKIVFENQEMLLTTALQKVNAVANGKAQIFEASELPAKPAPNSQYWVATYNGQTLDNGRYIILIDSLGAAHLVGKSVDSPSVNDVQINGTSIVDGATKTANIRPKTTIDATATENDIPSAKGVWDLVNAGGGGLSIEDVSNKIILTPIGNVRLNDHNAFKLGDKFLYLKCTFTTTSDFSASSLGAFIANLSGLENAGINNLMDTAGAFCSSSATGSTMFLGNKIYLILSKIITQGTFRFSFLAPINV